MFLKVLVSPKITAIQVPSCKFQGAGGSNLTVP